MAVDGLISGLDTTSLINQLMTLEAGPQTLLKAKVTTSNTLVTALQALNTSVASLATLAAKSATTESLDVYAATSSSSTVTTSAANTATSGSLDIVVDQLAQSQAGVTAAMTVASTTDYTLVTSDGTQTTITAASTDLDDVVTAINDAAAGITATKIASGTNTAGETQYRLQITGAETGADGAFALHAGTAAMVADGTSKNVLTDPGAAMLRTAQDASVTLWAGTSASQIITSSTNTFADLLPGVAVTVSAVSTAPVTVSVDRDDAAVSTIAKNLVDSLNTLFAQISTKSAVVSSTDGSGAAVVSGGIFSGDSTVRDVKQLIVNAASYPVAGRSPSEIGISITKTGTLEYDPDKFATAMADDPEFVKSVLAEISSRVAEAAANSSNKDDGLLTSRITGQQSLVKDLGSQIDNWDLRLNSRRSTLERTYSALEVQLSNMNAQSAWLTAQVESLNASKSNS
jgi:flagellar hook-associated protein 2